MAENLRRAGVPPAGRRASRPATKDSSLCAMIVTPHDLEVIGRDARGGTNSTNTHHYAALRAASTVALMSPSSFRMLHFRYALMNGLSGTNQGESRYIS